MCRGWVRRRGGVVANESPHPRPLSLRGEGRRRGVLAAGLAPGDRVVEPPGTQVPGYKGANLLKQVGLAAFEGRAWVASGGGRGRGGMRQIMGSRLVS